MDGVWQGRGGCSDSVWCVEYSLLPARPFLMFHQEVSDGRTSLLNVVKALGEYLTSEEDNLRTKGNAALSDMDSECSYSSYRRRFSVFGTGSMSPRKINSPIWFEYRP